MQLPVNDMNDMASWKPSTCGASAVQPGAMLGSADNLTSRPPLLMQRTSANSRSGWISPTRHASHIQSEAPHLVGSIIKYIEADDVQN